MKLELAVRTSSGTAATAAWEIIAGSTPGNAKLIELGIFLSAATSSVYGLGRPGAIGITPTTPVDFLQEDPNNLLASGVVRSAIAWQTGPTVPTNFMRRLSLPASIGAGVIWTFPEGIVIPASGSLVLWNIGTNSIVDAYAVVQL